jgi:hypothetical protein
MNPIRDALRCDLRSRSRDVYLNRVPRTRGRVTFFCFASATAPALLNHRDVANAENAGSGFLPTSCIRAVEKKVTKEKATRCRLNPALLRKPSLVFALRASRWLFKFVPDKFVTFTGGCQKGHPWPSVNARLPAAPLRTVSRRKFRCSARQTGPSPCRCKFLLLNK